jgi:hypothetical protein
MGHTAARLAIPRTALITHISNFGFKKLSLQDFRSGNRTAENTACKPAPPRTAMWKRDSYLYAELFSGSLSAAQLVLWIREKVFGRGLPYGVDEYFAG